MDLYQVSSKNPVLVTPNPKILSITGQPNVDIITSKALRREKEQKLNEDEICNVESKIIRLGGVEYHKTLCHHQLAGLN